jgi:two-component system C4-dicarboxylate transport sensor histidine kinase DctB
MIKWRLRLPLLLTLLLTLLLVAGVGIGTFRASVASSLDDLQQSANQRLDLYATSLESEIARYAHLPSILGLSQTVDALLHDTNNTELRQAANIYLERLTERTGARAIYLMDRNGHVIATSNWNQPDSFLGEDDSFRPYFQEAITGHTGRFFGVGTTRSEPGYYLSDGMFDQGQPLGVAVVKISLTNLERAWTDSKTLAMVADPNGVVILSSNPAWKFKTLRPISSDEQATFDLSLQYNRIPLKPLELREVRQLSDFARIVRPPKDMLQLRLGYSGSYLAQSRQLTRANWQLTELSSLLTRSDWQLIELSSLAPVYELAFDRAALGSALTAFAMLGLMLMRERRRRLRDKLAAREALQQAYNELERKVEERTADLSAANEQLQNEVAERTRTEKNLRQTQGELVQAGKLAVIGQLSTGIAHELNQPLAALRTLSGNTVKFLERGDLATASNNLATINELVDKMGQITGALKSFARKSTSSVGNAEVGRAIDNALFLLEQRLRRAGVTVARLSAPDTAMVRCDPTRLEQVLVNLFANALDELENTADARIEISSRQDGSHVSISVRDTGPGLQEEVRAHLFEPFFTTKPAGIGLGLGLTLSSSIIAEAGGTLQADNHPQGGAVFTLTLPAATKETGHA